jgi:hypothetical protein
MKRRVCNLLALSLVFSTASSWAQIKVEAPPDPPQSALDAQTFYQVLLGELNAQSSDPGTGFAFILDAARRTNDAKLYQRAVSIAFAGRSGMGHCKRHGLGNKHNRNRGRPTAMPCKS